MEWRAFCEQLWVRYAPYADAHFLSEIRHQFNARFWEMYLAVTFLEHDFALQRHPNGGPEFGIDLNGRRYWFDAIAPTSGTGPDAVPEPEYGAREARRVPQEQIILRLTGALAAKRQKRATDLAAGRIAADDGYVVAINGGFIEGCRFGSDMPYVVKALYGLGNIAVAIDTRTLEVVESRHQPRPTISKRSGVDVSSQPFCADECHEVSAVLYSNVDAANFPGRFGGDFLLLHNYRAAVPVPRSALPVAQEYWRDEEHLHMQDHS